jgi:hypothetical protein
MREVPGCPTVVERSADPPSPDDDPGADEDEKRDDRCGFC